MHFERRKAFQNAYNYIIFFFPEKKCPILPKILDPITQNTLIFLFGLTNFIIGFRENRHHVHKNLIPPKKISLDSELHYHLHQTKLIKHGHILSLKQCGSKPSSALLASTCTGKHK